MSEAIALRQAATDRYRPDPVKVLFVAESPPDVEERHFYFPNVPRADTLWVELTKVLYGDDFGVTKNERARKAEWLARFQADGYWMVEAVPEPIHKKRREAHVLEHKDRVLEVIADCKPSRVVLIATPVWRALEEPLRAEGVPLVQTGPVSFPGHGQQGRFREAMAAILPLLVD
ncbi:MAG: hypothetical protein F4Y80_14230 [Caldilineaceae bacterium SB0665_bin_21]|nr:hypothetical protein [Caldilineaceae bacterium SB0665_bin_21]MYA05471.1 hypothetical protein [Caldilineaceae bacterium SB0664_bin_22]MYC63654.1 hypothetical protein [Caldilineaceae bacterium SB0661_bin_34]